MNDPITEEEIDSAAAERYAETEQCVRRNPGAALLVAVAAGIVIGLILRALRPEPTPRDRMARLLEDFEHRLREAANPLLRKAGKFASKGVDALHESLHDGEAHVERHIGSARHWLRKFFA